MGWVLPSPNATPEKYGVDKALLRDNNGLQNPLLRPAIFVGGKRGIGEGYLEIPMIFSRRGDGGYNPTLLV